jgi:hypothetical protein
MVSGHFVANFEYVAYQSYSRFLPADVLWTFAMACNVYLSFFHQFDAAQLRAIEWKYLILCYGLPFIPALVLLFVNTPTRGKVYGDAVVSGSISLLSAYRC